MIAPAQTKTAILKCVILLLLTTPWLLPPHGAPSPSVPPLLFSLACAAALTYLLASFWQQLKYSDTKNVGQALAGAWLTAALFSSLIGLFQYFGVEHHFFFMSQSAGQDGFANLRQRNQFASLTNIGLVCAVWWSAQPSNVEKRSAFYVGLPLAAVVLACGNVASGSRTGLMQLGVVVAMCWWYWGRRAHRVPLVQLVLMAAVVSYLLSALFLPFLADKDLSASILGRLQDTSQTCQSRMTLWGNVLHLIVQKPWFGWGWGELDYAHFMTLYPGERFCDIADNAHNLPLHLAVELGIPGAVLICFTALWFVARAKPWREFDPTRQMTWTVLCLIMLHSLLEYPLWSGPFQIVFTVCLAILSFSQPSFDKRSGLGAGSKPIHKPPWLPQRGGLAQIIPVAAVVKAVAVALLVFVAFAYRDYSLASQIYRAPAKRSEGYRIDTLVKIRSSWLFQNQVRFAELTITPLSSQNAHHLNHLALQVLHYSPEARVAEIIVESAELLRHDAQAGFYLQRFQAAFPAEFVRWSKGRADRNLPIR